MPLSTLAELAPSLGTPKRDLETPTVVVDLDVMDANVERFAALADDHDVGLRSHTKAHKCPEIARMQDDLGGVLCQKPSEVEVMARHGVEDVLLVCPAVTERKLDRLAWVADRIDRFATLVDGPGNVDPLAAAAERHDTTLEAVLELDVGVGRMGVAPDEAGLLAERIDDDPNLAFGGVLGHDAHVTYSAETVAEFEAMCEQVVGDLETAKAAIEDAGVAVPEVITGSTSTARYVAPADVVTELDPGRYVFNDALLLDRRPDIGVEDCAATVLTTVISRPTADRAVVDAGAKTLAYGGGPNPVPTGATPDGIEFARMDSEHGILDLRDCEADVEVGDRLEFVVPNVYGAVNLRDVLVGVRDGAVEELWHVEARGKDK